MGFYRLLDSGAGERLEQVGPYVVRRPDPQIIWRRSLPGAVWQQADATFVKTPGGGEWQTKPGVPRRWQVEWEDLKLWVKLTPFKHIGVFAEQEWEWKWMRDKLSVASSQLSVRVLNLFGYTGVASLVCTTAGARVTHVDASRQAIAWARENQAASGLVDRPIRWMVDDVGKFVDREVRRKIQYDAIIMDPPVFGHGPRGETWQFHKSLPRLVASIRQILAPQPLFVLINAYAVTTSSVTLVNILGDLVDDRVAGEIKHGELTLNQENSPRQLSTGIWALWQTGLHS